MFDARVVLSSDQPELDTSQLEITLPPGACNLNVRGLIRNYDGSVVRLGIRAEL